MRIRLKGVSFCLYYDPCISGFGYARVLIISFLIVLCSVTEASCYQTANLKGDVLSVATDAANPGIVTVRNANDKDGLQLLVQQADSISTNSPQDEGTPQAGKPMEFNVVVRDEKGRTFQNPMAMIALRGPDNTATQNLYVILKNIGENAQTIYVVGEITLHMDLLQDQSRAVIPGRIFRIPVHSEFKQATLSVTSDNRLYVSIKELVDYPGLPMTMIYDISPGAKNLDPIKVLVPSKK